MVVVVAVMTIAHAVRRVGVGEGLDARAVLAVRAVRAVVTMMAVVAVGPVVPVRSMAMRAVMVVVVVRAADRHGSSCEEGYEVIFVATRRERAASIPRWDARLRERHECASLPSAYVRAAD